MKPSNDANQSLNLRAELAAPATPWLRRLATALGLTFVLGGGQPATASVIPALRNIVLVHGAFTDANVWSDVIVRLQAKGYTVSAVQLPLTSLAADVAATRHVLARQDGPAVLVGHSWGGAVISEAGVAPNVRALVYVSALAPDAGEAVATLQTQGPEAPGMRGARPDADGMLWFDPESYGAGLAADVAPARVGVLAATQRPIATAAFGETLTAAAWRDKPTWYLLSTDDQALAPDLQRVMATRMKARVTEVASSHMSPISQADAVVTLIDAAASNRRPSALPARLPTAAAASP